MYAVTAGSENSVNSVYTSVTATSRSVVRSPRSGGTRSLHGSGIDCRILTDGRDFRISRSVARASRSLVHLRLLPVSARTRSKPIRRDEPNPGVDARCRLYRLRGAPSAALARVH